MTKKNGDPNFDILGQYPIMNWEWPKIVVYVPLTHSIPYAPDVFPSFIEIARQGVPFMHLPYGFADRMRNEAVKQFMKTNMTHILMLDVDHVHPRDIVQKLARNIIEDPDRLIVGGLNFKRTEPFAPCVSYKKDDSFYRPYEWTPGLIEVDRLGFGCVLIAREAFERTEFPWFVNAPHYETETLGSHDNYFCEKAQEAGIKIWCDFRVTSPHMSQHRVTEITFRSYNEMNPVDEEDLINA